MKPLEKEPTHLCMKTHVQYFFCRCNLKRQHSVKIGIEMKNRLVLAQEFGIILVGFRLTAKDQENLMTNQTLILT